MSLQNNSRYNTHIFEDTQMWHDCKVTMYKQKCNVSQKKTDKSPILSWAQGHC